MQPISPAANPTTNNTNTPYGGAGQAAADWQTANNILNYLPGQVQQTTANATNANENPGSILPNISINAPTYTAPTAPTINAGNYGSNLTGYNAAVQNAEQGLTSNENSIYGSALNQLSSAEQQYGNLTPVYQQLASEYNIPGYQQDISQLSGLLGSLQSDVNADTSLMGGNVTASANQEKYEQQYQPLQNNLNVAGQMLQYGQNDVSNLLDTYEKSLTNQLNPLEQNISTLPELFGQTNSAAEAGYNQGYTSIQDLIQNNLQQQSINQQGYYNSLMAKEINANYGNGGSIGSAIQNGTLSGISAKNAKQGGGGGFDFTLGGKPTSANSWANSNGVPIASVLQYMASQGDQTALSALNDISKGANSQSVANKYPSLFWSNNMSSAQNNTIALGGGGAGNSNIAV